MLLLLNFLKAIGIICILLIWITIIYLSIKRKKILWDLISEALLITLLALNCFLQLTR